jgi:acyl-coenzyme A synthetase/AMP-(fatty) acid ligase
MITSLQCFLEGQSSDRVAVITPSGTLTIGDLLRLGADRRKSSALHNGASNESTRDFLVDIVAHDGWSRAIFFKPKTESLPSEWRGIAERDFSGPLQDGERTTWVIPTSGTTGVPKLIRHSLESLTATTKTDPLLGSRHRWGLLYDPSRFAGLQVVLQALLGSASLVAADGVTDLEGTIAFFAKNNVTSLSATPSQWRRLLMTSTAAMLKLTHVTLGGEIADQTTLTALRRFYPHARIAHVYASTEIGVAFSVTDGLAGFPLAYLEPGSLPRLELRVDSEGHLLARKHSVDASDDEHVFFDTHDLVDVRDGRVRFLGRSSGAINVGGNKITPEVIEAVLSQHPMVIAARVYPKPNPVMGNLVCADVELREGADRAAVIKDLNILCKNALIRWQCPAFIRPVDRVAVAPSGKIARGMHGD